MPDRAASTRPTGVLPRPGFRMADGQSNQSDVAGRWVRLGRARAGIVVRDPSGSGLFGHGDLLEGVVAAAALLLMVAIGVTPWLAIPLAVVTYVGVALLRPRRERRDEAVDDADREQLAGEATVDDAGSQQGADEVALANAAAVVARFGLTRREREILPLLAQRLTDREIAERLCISHRTAMNHTASVLGKLGLASRREVAAFAAERGLLPPPVPPKAGE